MANVDKDKLIESQEQSTAGRGNLPEAPLSKPLDSLDVRVVDNFNIEAFLDSQVSDSKQF